MKRWDDFYGDTLEFNFLLSELHSHSDFVCSVFDEKPRNILEIGIGSGRYSIFFSWLGVNVVGIDNNRIVVETAWKNNEQLNGTAYFHLADAFNLPYKDNSFDCLISQGLFEHFKDNEIVELLNEQIRVAKTVLFTVPNNYYRKLDFGNERLLSSKNWDEILQKGGFIFESKTYTIRNLSF